MASRCRIDTGPCLTSADPVLLAEMMGMRSLMLNLFAKASEGPISSEDLRKMSLYADSIKEQKAREFLAQRRLQKQHKIDGESTMQWRSFRRAFPWRIVLLLSAVPALVLAMFLGG